MSDLHLHHDLYREASARRARETEAWVRDQQRRRSARRRADLVGEPGLRVRFVALVARALGVAGQMTTTQHPAADKHTH